MARLAIPTRYQPAIAKIRRLDERTVREIREALDRTVAGRKINENAEPRDVAREAVASVSLTNTVDFKDIGEALGALYSVRSQRDVPLDQFVDDVCDALETLPSEDLRLPVSERIQFAEKLKLLLGADLFGIVAKVYDLATEDERVFCNARIVTDLRPVFGSRVEDGPIAMVVVHLLKLVYHSGSEKHREFFVSLDSEDLQALRKLLDRAEAKASSIKSLSSNVRLFGIKE